MAQSPFLNSFIFSGHPFFKTSSVCFPSNSIIVREYDKSVIAKSCSSNFFFSVIRRSNIDEITSQLFGPNHKILVLEFDEDFNELGKERLSISISFSIFEFLNFTI